MLGCAVGVATALLASLGQLHLSSASTVPSLTVPSLTVPTLSTPVTTPAVSTPAVTTPIVTVPKVTVPTVTVPPVTVPKVTVPKITVPTPTVSVPRATSPVHVPTVQTRSAPSPSASSLSTGSSSRGAPVAAGAGRSAQPAGGSATAATATGDGASASGSYVAGPSLLDGSADAGAGAGLAASRAARHRGPLSTKALRRLVTQLKGCLSSLAPRQTEVLVLRTGIGLHHGFSRQEVAKILGVSAKAEARLEQTALGGLGRVSTHTGCASVSSEVPASVRTAVLVTERAILGLSRALTVPGDLRAGCARAREHPLDYRAP